MTPRRQTVDAVLRDAGLRATKQRTAVLSALEGRDGFTTAQDLYHELRSRPESPGLATIYRTLASLAESGVLDSRVNQGEQAFRLCGTRHHHHLLCESCGRVEEVASEQVESWVERIARRRGFTVTAHTAEVYGICAACR